MRPLGINSRNRSPWQYCDSTIVEQVRSCVRVCIVGERHGERGTGDHAIGANTSTHVDISHMHKPNMRIHSSTRSISRHARWCSEIVAKHGMTSSRHHLCCAMAAMPCNAVQHGTGKIQLPYRSNNRFVATRVDGRPAGRYEALRRVFSFSEIVLCALCASPLPKKASIHPHQHIYRWRPTVAGENPKQEAA